MRVSALRVDLRAHVWYNGGMADTGTLFLTGYEGETLEAFLEKLEDSGVTSVIDIREIPLSRKNGFSGSPLQAALSSRGIGYRHLPELGSPTELREELHRSGDYLDFFKKYRTYVRGEKESLDLVSSLISENKNPAMLCFEKTSDLCHRTIVTSEILRRNPSLEVIQI